MAMHACTAEGDSAATALGNKAKELEQVKAELGRAKAEHSQCEEQVGPLLQKLQHAAEQL